MKLKQLIDFDVLSFDVICEKIRSGINFSLARYGDGEFNAMLGVEGSNCDGHEYNRDMGVKLCKTLRKKPEYFCAIHQKGKLQEKTIKWLGNNEMLDYKFISNAVFHCATRDGLFDQFWDALKHRKVVIVAPGYVKRQTAVYASKFVEIPGSNTYEHIAEIKSSLKDIDTTNTVFLICASMAAPLLVDWLYEKWGESGTFIDFGSSFDPVVGVKSRSFHKIAL